MVKNVTTAEVSLHRSLRLFAEFNEVRMNNAHSRVPNDGAVSVKWSRPPFGVLKRNFDASV